MDQSITETNLPQKTPFSKKTKYLKVIIKFIILLIIVWMGFICYQLIHIQEKTIITLRQTQTKQEQLQIDLQNIQNSFKKQEQLATTNKNMLTDLSQRFGQDKQGLLLSETEYFVRMANLSLYVQHDIPTTIHLLDNANKCLNRMGHSKFNPAQKVLVRHISTLKNIPQINWLDCYLKLHTISNQIKSLPLAIEDFKTNLDTTKKPDSTEIQPERKTTFKGIWQNIKKVLVIRHDKETVPLPLSPEQHDLLNLNLHLLLLQTQHALLQRQSQIYTTTLQQIQKILKQYYSIHDHNVQQILIELVKLQQIDIAPTLPNIREILPLIQKIKEQPTKMITTSKSSSSMTM